MMILNGSLLPNFKEKKKKLLRNLFINNWNKDLIKHQIVPFLCVIGDLSS